MDSEDTQLDSGVPDNMQNLSADRKTLFAYAQIPDLLEPDKRDMILSNIDSLSDEAVSALLQILSKAKSKNEAIDREYDLKELPLKENCLKIMADFQRSGIVEAVKNVEAKSGDKNPEQLTQILKKLDDNTQQP